MNFSTIEAFKHIRSKSAIELTPEQLKNLQLTLNRELADIDACCKRHGLTYELGGGSCLGAVRHHGFIPWDDDIDLNMPRSDHDLFVKFFREEYGDRYWVHTPRETEGYGLLLSRVLLKGTSVRTREDFHNKECGAFIDIFVIENTYDQELLRRLHGLGCMAFGFIQSCRKFYRDRRPLMELINTATEGDRLQYRRVFRIKIFLGFLFSFRSLDAWTRSADQWYSRCHNGHSKYVTIPSGKGHFFRECYLREDVCKTVPMEYDGTIRQVPGNYDLYLRRMYGKYMEIPQKKDLEKHIFFAPFYLQEDSDSSAVHD